MFGVAIEAIEDAMKALVFSDLHLAHCDLNYRLDFPSDVKVAIIAGDVWAPVASSLQWLFDHIVAQGLQVIFVAGNHEHYGHTIQVSIADGLAARARFDGLHWLENEAVVVDDC